MLSKQGIKSVTVKSLQAKVKPLKRFMKNEIKFRHEVKHC